MSTRPRRRMSRERRTMEAMMRLYCHDHHAPEGDLCPECEALAAYSRERIASCPWGTEKPTCANCPVHCYRPTERERMRAMMRYAGPRMLTQHPVLALLHLRDGRRPADLETLKAVRQRARSQGAPA